MLIILQLWYLAPWNICNSYMIIYFPLWVVLTVMHFEAFWDWSAGGWYLQSFTVAWQASSWVVLLWDVHWWNCQSVGKHCVCILHITVGVLHCHVLSLLFFLMYLCQSIFLMPSFLTPYLLELTMLFICCHSFILICISSTVFTKVTSAEVMYNFIT